MYKFSLKSLSNFSTDDKYTFFPFYEEVKNDNTTIYTPLPSSPLCGLTLKKASSMRFRWNELNEKRNNLFNEIEAKLNKTFVPVQLFHTKDVYVVEKESDTKDKIGDGIVTNNPTLMPTITVADCVPIYLFDKRTSAFGIVHSGWKGTGISENAIKLMTKKYGTKIEDVYAVIGPHIDSCCYIVNEERANYFRDNFTPLCIKKVIKGEKIFGNWDSGSGELYHLSLSVANVELLKKIGVKDSHISLCTDCTCCCDIYGSNRRETSLSGKANEFTVMAAFIAK